MAVASSSFDQPSFAWPDRGKYGLDLSVATAGAATAGEAAAGAEATGAAAMILFSLFFLFLFI